MLGIYPDTLLQHILIIANKWSSRHPQVQKSTKTKPKFYDSQIINPRFSMTENEGMVFLVIDSMVNF